MTLQFLFPKASHVYCSNFCLGRIGEPDNWHKALPLGFPEWYYVCTCMCVFQASALQCTCNFHNTDATGTLSNCPYYRGVLCLEVSSVALTCITETTLTGKRRPKWEVWMREIFLYLAFGLVNQPSSCGTAALVLVIALRGVALTIL